MPPKIRPGTVRAQRAEFPNPIPEEFRGHLGFVLARARLELIRRLDVVIQPSGLYARHFALARLLQQRPGLSQVEIAGLLGTDRTTTMKMIDELERQGLVSRSRSHTDRRANTLRLTKPGERWMSALLPTAVGEEERFLAPLSPGERALLQELLVRLVRHATVADSGYSQDD